MEMEMELETEVETETEQQRQYGNQGKRYIKVYVDEQNDRYYISVSAAASLGLITNEEYDKKFDIGHKYYPITKYQLKLIEEQFIVEYEVIVTKKQEQERERIREFEDGPIDDTLNNEYDKDAAYGSLYNDYNKDFDEMSNKIR